MNWCSSCYFSSASKTLEDAEEEMLKLYCERSNLKDGQTVLDVGCGWGSLALYIAKKYSNSRVTGICNSTTQKAYIEEKCRYTTWYSVICFRHCACHIIYKYFMKHMTLAWRQYLAFESYIVWWSKSLSTSYIVFRDLQLQNLDIIVADISIFEMEASYDRIFSIEMFEVRICGVNNLHWSRFVFCFNF